MDMALSMDNIVISNEEEISMMKAMHLPCGLFLNMVIRAAIEVDLFEIIAKSTTQKLSSNEIASQIPTKNPNASLVLERILRFLASQSFLTCNITKNDDGNIHTSYTLTPLSQSLISDKDGSSIVPLLLLNTGSVGVNAWFHLKDAILEGEIPFNKAHGMHAFEYNGKDSRMNGIIDVGGGLGISLASIISKYPNIKGINFDLLHVIQDAPIYEGIEHVGGDMWKNIPQGELIILKAVLHNWDDEDCVKILKNCWRALPKDGKVIVIERIQPEYPETNILSKHSFSFDISIIIFHGGKERAKQQFEDLPKQAGFTSLKVVARAYYSWVMELYKY
ncbi:hypothetical protein H5410_034610 [Solanum commersonii]|uniref:Uncharacterized protein n=1 Tax=Solanum commersonii TaxID=4109 RepID=A0A9J5YTZ3_SOLCO|nr:hypothetical protein H5410_034610 [Solanum commersonii]